MIAPYWIKEKMSLEIQAYLGHETLLCASHAASMHQQDQRIHDRQSKALYRYGIWVQLAVTLKHRL